MDKLDCFIAFVAFVYTVTFIINEYGDAISSLWRKRGGGK